MALGANLGEARRTLSPGNASDCLAILGWAAVEVGHLANHARWSVPQVHPSSSTPSLGFSASSGPDSRIPPGPPPGTGKGIRSRRPKAHPQNEPRPQSRPHRLRRRGAGRPGVDFAPSPRAPAAFSAATRSPNRPRPRLAGPTGDRRRVVGEAARGPAHEAGPDHSGQTPKTVAARQTHGYTGLKPDPRPG